jgi:hypothetical protein
MRNLVWIVAFVGLAFVGDRIGGYFLQKMTEKSQFRYSRMYQDTTSADILLVGNSRGLTFYQPEIEKVTGLKTLNISYNGMPADLAKNLVMDYLDKHSAPKTMVVDVTMCDRINDVLVQGFNLYTPYSFRLDTLIKGYDKTVVYGGKVSHLYRYNSEIFQRALYYRNKTDKDWLLDRVISDKMANDTAMKSYKTAVFDTMVLHLKDMVAFAQSKGVDVKLVINPYYPPFETTMRDSFLNPLIAKVEQATNLKVKDYSRALSDKNEFGDYQHPNKAGSIHYMNILFGEMQSESNLIGSNFSTFGSNQANADLLASIDNLPSDSLYNIDTTTAKMRETAVVVPKENLKLVSVQDTSRLVKKIYRKKRHSSSNKYWQSVDTMFMK